MPIGLGSIMAGANAGTLLGALIPPLGRDWSYLTNSWNPNLKYDVSSAIQLRWRKVIAEEEYHDTLKAQGIVKWRANNIYELGARLLDGMQLITLERRDKIDPEVAIEQAERIGLRRGTYAALKDITEMIPSASDIISFAVREVYTPEIAEAFGQFDGLEQVLKQAAKDIKAIGMSDDTFKKYWAAHWMLPSVGQGFEMVQRAVIPEISTPEQPLGLDRLMTALDIMPAWRDKLTAISYSPFTRVDVRRMHKIGVLDDFDVFKAYADVGFSPYAEDHYHTTIREAFECEVCRSQSKVGSMLDFTILYNFKPPAEEQTEEDTERAKQKDLTKADVLNGYRDGLLSPSETDEVLHRLGYSPDEIAYYKSREDYRSDAEEVDTQLRYLHDAYVYRVMDFNEVTDRMGALNLPSSRVERLFAVWDIERLVRARKPTKAELLAFLRQDIIGEPVFREEMEGLGYSLKYIDWYLLTIEPEKLTQPPKLTRSELVSFARKGVIDKPTFIARMKELDYSKQAIDWYLATLKPPEAEE